MNNVGQKAVLTAAFALITSGAYTLGAQEAQETTAAQETTTEHSQTPGLTFQGDMALWTVAIKPDKTADFEAVLAKVRDALQKSDDPERKQQAAGWRVLKMSTPLQDGNVAYVHIINPVVAGADYTILKAIYDEFPDESQQMYELYRGAFAQNLAVASGSIVIDMSKTP